MNLEMEVREIDEPFIQAIDDRLIRLMMRNYLTKFVLLHIDPRAAYRRVTQRLKNVGDENATIREVAEYQEAEMSFFKGILERFGVPRSNWRIIDNSENTNCGREELMEFMETR